MKSLIYCCQSRLPGFLHRGTETYNAVELRPLVPLRLAQVVLGLARAELPEVLGGLGDHVREELELDPAQGFSCAGVSGVSHVTCLTRGNFRGDVPPRVMSKKTLGMVRAGT